MTVYLQEAGADMWQIDADVFVVPTNTRGIFGAGLALAFAQWRPDVTSRHIQMCHQLLVGPGDVYLDELGPNLYGQPARVAFFATKEDPQEPSRMRWLAAGLPALAAFCRQPLIAPRNRIALPAIGCGLGGLDWASVHTLILRELDPCPILEVALFPPHDPPLP